MSEFNKYSTDGGATFIDVEDSNAVHYGEQAKGYIGKNLLKNNASTTTISDVTFTVNSDGSVTINGTASANITSFFINSNMTLKAGSYWLTGNPSGITGTSYGLRIANTSYSVNTFFEQGKILTLNQDYSDLRIDIRIPSGQVINNLTFYPMIRLSSIPDSTYEPFLTPNTDLMSYADNAVLGAKNFIPFPYKSSTSALCTNNADGSITVNGSTTSSALNYIIWDRNSKLPKGKYIVSKGTTNSTVLLNIAKYSNGSWIANLVSLTDKEHDVFTIDYADYDEIVVYIYVASNKTIDNVKVYPMIRLASDTDDTYVQYAMTNRELTEVQKITFLNDTTNSRFIKGYKVGRIVNICIKGSFPQNDTYPTLDTPIPDSWYPYESIAVSNYSAGQNTGTAFAMIDVDSKKIRISNVANVSYYNTTLSYISKG